MTLRQLSSGDHPQDVVRKLEEPQPVGDARRRAADTVGDLAHAQTELVHQDRVGARLLHRRQLLARDVLDEGQEERLLIVRLADERGHLVNSRLLGRAPAPLAGDELVAAGRPWPDDDGL
jgi:hypothetical protein